MLALGVRVIFILITSNHNTVLTDDAAGYHSSALNLLEKGQYINDSGLRAHRVPAYPLFLAMIYLFFGVNILVVQLLQAVLSALACLFLYQAGRLIISENAALSVGLFAALYFDMFEGTVHVLTETLYIFLIALFFFLLFRKSARFWRYSLLGLTAGALGLTRPEGLLWGILGGLYMIITEGRKSIIYAVVFLSLSGAWVVRNYLVFDRIIIGTTLSGASLYYGIQRPLVELGKAPSDTLYTDIQDEIERNEYFNKKAKEVYRDTSLKTKLSVWVYGLGVMFYPFRPAFDVTMIFLLPLWLYGAYGICRSKDRAGLLLLGYVAGSMALYCVVGGVAARYRQPIAPGIILLAAFGVSYLWEKWTRPVFQVTVLSWMGMNLLIWPFASRLRDIALAVKHHLWS